MSRQINFLAERQKGISKQQQQDMRSLRLFAVVLGFACVTASIIYGLFFFYTYRFTTIKTQEKAIRNQIVGNQENEAAFVVYARKLATLTTIYKDRQDKNNIISYFSELFGNDVIITGIDFDQKDKLLHFKVKSNDVFVFQRVLAVANSEQVKNDFPTLGLSTLSRKEDASYEVTISVPITKPVGQQT
jgi:hypothetical protein